MASEDYTVVVADSARDAAEEHCFSRVDVEVGGFLVGSVDGDEVTVTDAHPALTASSAQTHLTFTHEAWAEILEVMDSTYPGKSIVGWYHSHPGFGCFLSDYDIFIQENFFSAPGQHALVIDPLAGKWARFVASEGKSSETASGKTEREALGENLDKADIIASTAATSGKRRVWPAVAVGIVVTAVIVGAVAWFLGQVQGQDAGAAAAQSRVDAAEAQVVELQSQAAAAAAQPTEPAATPSPQATVAPSPEATPVPLGLAVGQRGTFAWPYVVKSGDSLWNLAQKYLGDGNRYRDFYKNNPGLRESGLVPGATIQIHFEGTLKGTD